MSQSKSRLTVLVADDHTRMRNCIVEILDRKFCVIGAVADGEELVSAATQLLPDVIVSDVWMPKLNGPDAKQVLLESGVGIPFVFITSDSRDARQIWRNLSPCINKLDVFTALCPAVRQAAMRGGMEASSHDLSDVTVLKNSCILK